MELSIFDCSHFFFFVISLLHTDSFIRCPTTRTAARGAITTAHLIAAKTSRVSV
jgi:hypothetical protein